METFSALLALCAGKSPVTGEFTAQRPVTRSFDVFFDPRLSKQSWGWWLETPSRSLWRHWNEWLINKETSFDGCNRMLNNSMAYGVLTHCALLTSCGVSDLGQRRLRLWFCLTTPIHYLNQYQLIVSKFQWYSSFEGNFIRGNNFPIFYRMVINMAKC